MRIGLIAPPWLPVPPVGYGGTEMVLDELARGLVDAGHEVVLFTTGDSTCPVPMDWVLPEAAGTVATGPATELRHVVRAYDALQEWGADVIHDHTLVGPVYGTRFGTPVVTTNHGPFAGELGDVYRAIGGQVPIVALSEHHASTAVDTPVAAVIHHGIDVEALPFGRGEGDYGLFLGRMSPDKGVDVAVRVARRAGVALKIAAKMREPAEQAFFREQIEPYLGDGVEYIGEVGARDKYALIADASFLLNPLAWPEPFGLVMIEALACGTPVIATPCGSVPELVTDGVTGFVSSSEEGLVDALAHVAQLDRERCRKEALTRFSAQRMVEDHIALYTRVHDARHRTRTTRRPARTKTTTSHAKARALDTAVEHVGSATARATLGSASP